MYDFGEFNKISNNNRDWFYLSTRSQEMLIFVRPIQTCLEVTIFIFWAQILHDDSEHSESIKLEFREHSGHSESNQTLSYSRGLKYFFLLENNSLRSF